MRRLIDWNTPKEARDSNFAKSIDFGKEHGFSDEQITTAIVVAHCETQLGMHMPLRNDTNMETAGLYQYFPDR